MEEWKYFCWTPKDTDCMSLLPSNCRATTWTEFRKGEKIIIREADMSEAVQRTRLKKVFTSLERRKKMSTRANRWKMQTLLTPIVFQLFHYLPTPVLSQQSQGDGQTTNKSEINLLTTLWTLFQVWERGGARSNSEYLGFPILIFICAHGPMGLCTLLKQNKRFRLIPVPLPLSAFLLTAYSLSTVWMPPRNALLHAMRSIMRNRAETIVYCHGKRRECGRETLDRKGRVAQRV